MEALEAILTRRSTRNYKSDAVEEKKLDQKAVCHSPV